MDEKLEVFCDNLEKNPHCQHGPTLLFKKTTADKEFEEYYACSAHRSFKGCKFHQKKSLHNNEKRSAFVSPYFDPELAQNLRAKILLKSPEKRCYCHTCNMLFKSHKLELHKDHKVHVGISYELFCSPTQILQPLSNNKSEAQYFFNDTTLQFLGNCFKSLNITKVICLGAPRLHEYLKNKYKKSHVKSFLLDLDHRFFYFLCTHEFAWFNMFNCYFFEGNPKVEIFESFLKLTKDENILLFTDPPFGCRTEPLINTIKEITKIYHRVNEFQQILPVFWIFPYFMDLYIKKFMPEMEMLDYKINYTNHDLFNDTTKGRKQGSPVRIFTNIPVNLIELPQTEGYKFCRKCDRWSGIENIHCDKCKKCPSKNGETYRHCNICATCVKPKYVHCRKCGRCTQKVNHSCEDLLRNLHCWICKERGHNEINCKKWKRYSKRFKRNRNAFKAVARAYENDNRICLLCTKSGHNEKQCPKRKSILKEIIFMGTEENIFNRS